MHPEAQIRQAIERRFLGGQSVKHRGRAGKGFALIQFGQNLFTETMRIIGIDPGTAITGWGVVESDGNQLMMVAYGVVTTPAGTALPKRLQTIYHKLTQVIEQWQPESSANVSSLMPALLPPLAVHIRSLYKMPPLSPPPKMKRI